MGMTGPSRMHPVKFILGAIFIIAISIVIAGGTLFLTGVIVGAIGSAFGGASLWVMVVDNTGKVFHVLPNINRTEHLVDDLGEVQDGLRRIRVLWSLDEFGADPKRLAMQVTEGDYGKSEVIAILSKEPLFDMRRPRDESVSSLAEALADTLQGREDQIIGVASRIIDARP